MCYPQAVPVAELVELRSLPAGNELYNGPLHPGPGPSLQIQSMGDLGRIRDLDRTLAGTLMAEFSRVQLIVQEDVGKSLVALRSDLLAACSAFLADVGRIMDVPHADPRLALLEAPSRGSGGRPH